MLFGIGTDIMKAGRIMCLPADDTFFLRVFTDREREQAASSEQPLRYFASHFSGKEAIFKALSADPDRVRLNEIEILNSETGVPLVTLHGDVKQYAQSMGIQNVLLSLSWEEEYCIAFACALSV